MDPAPPPPARTLPASEDELRHRAVRAVATAAHDADDAVTLLAHLGLLGDVRTARRGHAAVRQAS